MKKSIIIIFLLTVSFSIQAQTKEQPNRPKYKKFIAIDFVDYDNFMHAISEWRRLIIYDPSTSSDNKISLSKDLDTYISQLPQKAKLDSTLIIYPDSIKATVSKKK